MQRAFNVVEKPSATSSVDSELEGFLPEGGAPPAQPSGRSRVPLVALAVVALIAFAAGGWFFYSRALGADTAALRIESAPTAATVTVDGVAKGTTPLDLTLPSGPHKVVLAQGQRTQQLDVALTRGGSVVHHISWPVEVAATPTVGSLSVASEPSGVRFTVDGVDRGDPGGDLEQDRLHAASVCRWRGLASRMEVVRMIPVNVVVLAGTVAADPVQRVMPSGDAVTEVRLSVPEAGKRLLPLPIALWHADIGAEIAVSLAKGDSVLVYGSLVRRFYRSGAGARSLTEVVASGVKRLAGEEAVSSGD